MFRQLVLARIIEPTSKQDSLLLPIQRRSGPTDPARHRRAGRQGRESRRRERVVRRNRFVRLSGGTRTVNRTPEATPRALAGPKGNVTNLAACTDGTLMTADFVIDAYHRLFQIEKSFRISKHDLRARPIYHHQRESIEHTSQSCSPPSPSAAGSKMRWDTEPDNRIRRASLPSITTHKVLIEDVSGRAAQSSVSDCVIRWAGGHADGMTDRDDFLAWVRTSLYEAELALHKGDAAPRRALWCRNEPCRSISRLPVLVTSSVSSCFAILVFLSMTTSSWISSEASQRRVLPTTSRGTDGGQQGAGLCGSTPMTTRAIRFPFP
jgi:hypothetical protein